MEGEQDYEFVDQHGTVHTGRAAKEKILNVNDLRFVSDEGIVAIDKKRWSLAQSYERRTWLARGLSSRDDRNIFHFNCFGRYEILRGRSFLNAIEIGCGPFTNLRLIQRVAEIATCDLLDPLINDYIRHPYCYYDENRLYGCGSTTFEAKIRKVLHKPLMRISRFSRDFVPINRIISTPLEDMNVDQRYDLIVMINVIEHCYNVDEIFDRLLSLSKPDTVFVFHDVFFDELSVREKSQYLYDTGHPLRLGEKKLRRDLLCYFDAKLQREEVGSYHKKIWFIGERK